MNLCRPEGLPLATNCRRAWSLTIAGHGRWLLLLAVGCQYILLDTIPYDSDSSGQFWSFSVVL